MVYDCECSVCHKICKYHRIISVAPVCVVCQQEMNALKVRKNLDSKTISRFLDWLSTNYTIRGKLNEQVSKEEILEKYSL